ncbi:MULTISPECIES: helix-turn-helix domain-containing protein [Delftia]|uniref:helix-turn-helix domain-containing protein n=1 Tax=Delftia TaxID=80865 RepID=UPI0009B74CDB|nr:MULTISPECIES: helix-turn-helix domain-containing protein [Delftia]MDR6731169.1 lambda repressor-like predicted transcriptional regulator [Delftia lacustris]WEL96566.1 helix-turn-helix domain-containing protein [Delftia tsuruhatensis]
MHPEQIKAAMRMKGVTPTALADQLGVANSTVSQVISGRSVSARIRAQIAEVTGYSVEAMWPTANARPTLRRSRDVVLAMRRSASA